MSRITLALIAGAPGALLLPGAAEAATTYCVHQPAGCVGTVQPDLPSALTAAQGSPGKDTIRIGVGLFNEGPVVDAAGNPVDIVGTASNQTAITSSSNANQLVILDIQEPGTTISKLRVHHTSASPVATGIVLKGSADDVLVTNQTLTGQFDGIRMVGSGAAIDNSAVDLVYPANIQNRAIFVAAGATASIDDSFLQASVGVSAGGGNPTVRRTRIHADQGVVASAGSTTQVSDTAIRVPGPMASNFQLAGLAAAGDVKTTLNADRVTVHAIPPQGKTPYGVWVAPNGGAGNDSAVDLQGSVLDGFSKDFVATQSAGATAKVTTSYSAYRFGAGFKQLTGGATVTAGAGNFDLTGLSPNFVDPANGDLHLRFDSPLLERGDPNFNPFLGVDLDRNPRVRNGDGAGLATVDIGAYEYQRKAPLADVQASPSGPGTGETVTFDASGSTDPDKDAITFAWSFDDGGSATGPVAQHSFATPGPHTGTVTVTDSTGLTGTAMATVTVASPPGPGGGPGGGAPGLGALTLQGLRLVPATFRARQPRRARSAVRRRPPVGTTIRFRLSADARVTFTVERPVRVRRRTRWLRAGAFTRSAKVGTNGVRFDGRFAGRALRPGRYRLRARAQDGQGRLSAATAPKSFVIATS